MFNIRKLVIITIFSMLLIAVVSGCSTVPATSGSSASPTGAGSSTAPATSSSPATPGTLIVEPQSGLAPYLSLVQSAQHSIDVNSYLLTDRDLVSTLVQKAQDGVSVKVIVAGNPYHDQKAVAQEQAEFAGTKVQLKIAPSRFEGAYVFDHAKYLIADQTAILGSSNMDYSGLGVNREYDYQTSDPSVVADLADVFNADWAGQKADLGNLGPLVVSPGSQDALASLIQNAKKRLYIEMEELGNDRPVLNAVAAAVQRGVQVEVVLPSKSSAGDRRNAQELASAGAQVRYLSQPYPHAKLIIADNRAFLGSQNISASSLDKNREVGIVLGGTQVDQLVQVFQRGFAAGVQG